MLANDDPHEGQDECKNTDEWHEEADAKDEAQPTPAIPALARDQSSQPAAPSADDIVPVAGSSA